MARPQPKRRPTTVYLDPRICRAAKVKAAATGKTLSDLANEGLSRILREDEQDLRMIRERRKERTRPYDVFLKELRKDGLI